MPSEPVSLAWLVNKAWVLLVGWFWYDKKEQRKKDDERDSAIQKIQLDLVGSYVTEPQLKKANTEALAPYKEDQQDIKVLLKELNSNVVSLSKDMAIQNAIRSMSHDDDTTSGS